MPTSHVSLRKFRQRIATSRPRRIVVVKRKQRRIRRKDDRAFTKVAVTPGESVINNRRTLDLLLFSLFDALRTSCHLVPSHFFAECFLGPRISAWLRNPWRFGGVTRSTASRDTSKNQPRIRGSTVRVTFINNGTRDKRAAVLPCLVRARAARAPELACTVPVGCFWQKTLSSFCRKFGDDISDIRRVTRAPPLFFRHVGLYRGTRCRCVQTWKYHGFVYPYLTLKCDNVKLSGCNC